MPPVYLGHIKFGTGPGCDCEGGARRIWYRKQHHLFGISANGRSIYFYSPPKAFLHMVAYDWVLAPNGTYTINRLTGMADGTWNLHEADWDGLYSYDEDSSIWHSNTDPDTFYGIEFSSEYTLATLLSDLNDIVTEPTLSIFYVPTDETWLAGRVESSNPWTEDLEIGSSPADGRFAMQFAQLGSGIVNTGGLLEATLYSTFERIYFAERQRLLAPFVGHFSLERGYLIEQLPGLGDPTEVTEDRRYFYLDSGALDLMSPEIDSTLAATATFRFRSWEHLRIGDMPPPGTEPTHVTGVSGAGSWC